MCATRNKFPLECGHVRLIGKTDCLLNLRLSVNARNTVGFSMLCVVAHIGLHFGGCCWELVGAMFSITNNKQCGAPMLDSTMLDAVGQKYWE